MQHYRFSVMANYGVLPITDSFSIQRCLTWSEPSRPVPAPRERPQFYARTRPVSGTVSALNFIRCFSTLTLLDHPTCKKMSCSGNLQKLPFGRLFESCPNVV